MNEALVTLQPTEFLSVKEIDILVSILNNDTKLRRWLYPNEANRPALTRDEFISIGREWVQKNKAKTYCIVTDKPIGIISISHITDNGSARIGYWITSRDWGKGFGSRAFDLTLEKARQIGIREISASIDSQNMASIAIWAKHGASQKTIGDQQIEVRLRINVTHRPIVK